MTVDAGRPRLSTRRGCAWCGTGLDPDARFCPGCDRAVAAAASVPDRPPHEWLHDDGLHDQRLPVESLPDEAQQGEPAAADSSGPTSLLESLGGTWDEAARSPETRARRWVSALSVTVVVVLFLSAAGVFGLQQLRDRPVRDAFLAAQRTYSPAVTALAAASDLDDVAEAGERFAEGSATLETRLRAVATRDTTLAAAVEDVLVAQVAAAHAGGRLAGLDGEHLDSWGSVREGLRDSFERVASATRTLAAVDPGAAAAVDDGADALRALELAVVGETAASAESTLTALLVRLGQATTTEDVRAVASEAAAGASAAGAALREVTEPGPEADLLDAVRGVHRQLARLHVIDADHLRRWDTRRASVATSLAALPSGQARDAGDAAVASVDRLVSRGTARLEAWRAEYRAAVEDRASDRATLKEYRAGMRVQLRTYSALRADLSAWITRVEDSGAAVSYQEGYTVLSEALADRQAVRDVMSGLTVPDDVGPAHGELVGVVDDAIAAVRSAYDGTADADDCAAACYYRQTPGWQAFSEESARITETYRAAVESWTADVAAARAAIAARPLPQRPMV